MDRFPIRLAALIGVFVALPLVAESKGYHRLFLLIGPEESEQVRGLAIHELATRGMVNRYLLETPIGSRLVLTKSLSAPAGTDTRTILSDDTGWEVSLTLVAGAAPTLDEYFQKAVESTHESVTLEIRHPGSAPFQNVVAVRSGKIDYGSFADRFRPSDSCRALRPSTPSAMVSDLAFLHRALTSDPDRFDGLGYEWFGLVETVLTCIEGSVPPRPSEPWNMKSPTIEQGLTVLDAEMLGFVAGFKSVENANPLSGSRVDELVGADNSNPRH